MNKTRHEAIRRCEHWWYCDNVVSYPHIIALLHMDFPRVFILIRDYEEAYFATYEEFRDGIAEINFFDSTDRDNADIDALLTDAWNFLALQEEEDERLCGEYEAESF